MMLYLYPCLYTIPVVLATQAISFPSKNNWEQSKINNTLVIRTYKMFEIITVPDDVSEDSEPLGTKNSGIGKIINIICSKQLERILENIGQKKWLVNYVRYWICLMLIMNWRFGKREKVLLHPLLFQMVNSLCMVMSY